MTKRIIHCERNEFKPSEDDTVFLVKRWSDRQLLETVLCSDKLILKWQIVFYYSPVTSFFYIKSSIDRVGKDEFISYLLQRYPDDFLWLSFHPEIFEGRYDE